MFGKLPRSLTVCGNSYKIRTDYRTCLNILIALSDVNLTDFERATILIECLYFEPNFRTEEEYTEAIMKGLEFLSCGSNNNYEGIRLYDLEKDEQIIFSGINKVVGKDIRTVDYLHFWTFIGYYNEIGEGQFSTVVSIRKKLNNREKLSDWEKDFYRRNKELVDLKPKESEYQKAQKNEVRKLLGLQTK